MKVLISGATGNVGVEVIRALQNADASMEIYAGVRDVQEAAAKTPMSRVQYVAFDFTDATTCAAALEGCDLFFLLRPPQLSAVDTYFKPIIDICRDKRVQHIVFLSVQGVERSRIIPHHQIEQLIVASKIPYTFLRPAYFMQNFTTTLRDDLVQRRRIYLPAGRAVFTLVDVRDVGAVAAAVLKNTAQHVGCAYDLTSADTLSFADMARILGEQLGFKIEYRSPNLIAFWMAKQREKVPPAFILVMIMLHYLPRFQKTPVTTRWVEKIGGSRPRTFSQFVADYRDTWME